MWFCFNEIFMNFFVLLEHYSQYYFNYFHQILGNSLKQN